MEIGFDELKNVCVQCADEVGKYFKKKIYLDSTVLRQCYESAVVSENFHGTIGTVNHIRRASHFMFWLVKLKPFLFSDTIVEKVFDTLEPTLSTIDPTMKDRRQAASEIFLNEFLALLIGKILILRGYIDIKKKLVRALADKKINKADLQGFESLLASNKIKFQGLIPELTDSFRDHNYSSRGLATMMMCTFYTGFENGIQSR